MISEAGAGRKRDFMTTLGLTTENEVRPPPQAFNVSRSLPQIDRKQLERNISFSSLAGVVFNKNSLASPEYIAKQLEVMEANCHAQPDMEIQRVFRKERRHKQYIQRISNNSEKIILEKVDRDKQNELKRPFNQAA